jgi:hypothetical protein
MFIRPNAIDCLRAARHRNDVGLRTSFDRVGASRSPGETHRATWSTRQNRGFQGRAGGRGGRSPSDLPRVVVLVIAGALAITRVAQCASCGRLLGEATAHIVYGRAPLARGGAVAVVGADGVEGAAASCESSDKLSQIQQLPGSKDFGDLGAQHKEDIHAHNHTRTYRNADCFPHTNSGICGKSRPNVLSGRRCVSRQVILQLPRQDG